MSVEIKPLSRVSARQRIMTWQLFLFCWDTSVSRIRQFLVAFSSPHSFSQPLTNPLQADSSGRGPLFSLPRFSVKFHIVRSPWWWGGWWYRSSIFKSTAWTRTSPAFSCSAEYSGLGAAYVLLLFLNDRGEDGCVGTTITSVVVKNHPIVSLWNCKTVCTLAWLLNLRFIGRTAGMVALRQKSRYGRLPAGGLCP